MLAAHAVPVALQAKNRIQLHTWKASKRKGRKLWCLRLQTIQQAVNDGPVFASAISEFWFYENMHEL
jgi:hypothetical protein